MALWHKRQPNLTLSGPVWSQVGFRGPGKGAHTVQLASDYCRKKVVIQHETMHALGFHHEMTRPDRDQFIKINWPKIKVPQSL